MDLFAHAASLERLPLERAEIYFLACLNLGLPADLVRDRLIHETPWRQETVTVWGKRHPQPRLVAWYGDLGRRYTYSGITLEPLPWTDLLLDLKGRVERVAEVSFNSVLLNYYRNNRDSMGFHSDDEAELGARPVIASLSVGEERTMIFKSRVKNLATPSRIKLPSGSLLIMKGDTQANWKHAIEKEARFCSARINLTFRRIVG